MIETQIRIIVLEILKDLFDKNQTITVNDSGSSWEEAVDFVSLTKEINKRLAELKK